MWASHPDGQATCMRVSQLYFFGDGAHNNMRSRGKYIGKWYPPTIMCEAKAATEANHMTCATVK